MAYVHAPQIYSAFRHSAPAVLSIMNEEDFVQMHTDIKTSLAAALQFQIQNAQQVASAQASNYTSSYTQISPAASWVVLFGSMLIGTVKTWDQNNFETNAWHVFYLSGMVVVALHAAQIYWKTNYQSAVISQREQKNNQIQTLVSGLEFLRQSSKMAKKCLQNNPPANLAVIYPVFDDYLKGLPGGIVPNYLASSWGEVGRLIHLPADDPQRAQIPIIVQQNLIPLMKHYSEDIHDQLQGLGYTVPQELDVQIEPAPVANNPQGAAPAV